MLVFCSSSTNGNLTLGLSGQIKDKLSDLYCLYSILFPKTIHEVRQFIDAETLRLYMRQINQLHNFGSTFQTS